VLAGERRAAGEAPEEPVLSEEELARLEEEAARRPRPKPLPAAWLRGYALGRETRIRRPLGGAGCAGSLSPKFKIKDKPTQPECNPIGYTPPSSTSTCT
jgi:hypothetical protein